MPAAASVPSTAESPPRAAPRDRLQFVDVFRGVLMLHMALDHASLFFNRARFANEHWDKPPAPPATIWQFLTRFTGVFVAPGFSFIAGFMVAVTSDRRASSGADEAAVTRRLIVRGLVLIVAEAVVLGLPIGHLGFDVLSCLGACLIVLALVRRWPTAVLLPAGLAILALHPLIPPAPDSGPLAVILRILHDTSPLGRFRALYPVIPWLGVMLVGFVCGRDYLRDRDSVRRWTMLGLASAVAFLAVRLPAGAGNAYGYERVGSYEFFTWAKYPPDWAWLTWSFMTIFLVLALLRSLEDAPILASPGAEFVATFGRAPLFFYLVHFWVLGLMATFVPSLTRALPLGVVWLVWAALLALLWWPCRAYARHRETYPRSIWKYL